MNDGLAWYFAYGSNMDPARLVDERLKPKGVVLDDRIGGRLEGWRLTFDKRARSPVGSGAGNIVSAPGSTVHGTLNALPPEGFDVLDVWEGVAGGHYERRIVPIIRADNGMTVQAITYIALLTGEGLRPTRAYLNYLLAGRDLLPTDYWEWLKATPTFD
ncbi:AIG2-like family protein [Enhydrobacter aerosaccus]|uniref:AIG2-like family protein n=1 Tax=Enhydrobacter aerosaccus TaxID=225324 RepID=A0A1T4TFN6_9HYPH|nr:gamma-glutamylcyclotransferase family protein [Enhydrobacter aerosaccus]SKA39237.1 AIG2-like family protein [Enhydrobacter aerosaccus]